MPTTSAEVPPKSSFHPAFGVNNIKNSIPLVLDRTDGQYASWMELFNIHVCAYNVLDHIQPTATRPTDIDDATWLRVDAIVKQWVFATISQDLIQRIMKSGATAQELWNRLAEIFQDNKATRTIYLEEQFNSTRLEAFSSIHEYTSRIKSLADQLANVGNPLSETKMVLQMISGLTKREYDTVATLIQQIDLLPSFNKACFQFLLEETRRKNQSSHSTHALITQKPSDSHTSEVAANDGPTASRGGCGGHQGNQRGGGRYNNSDRGCGRGRGATITPDSSMVSLGYTHGINQRHGLHLPVRTRVLLLPTRWVFSALPQDSRSVNSLQTRRHIIPVNSVH
ncbi:hypothetical protein L1887_16451 [Cichorium endivia]|nr:hypothetical protein L1887_16451 [Cichorium endivia]